MPKKNDELIFLPLGGVGEIGMNLSLYGFGSAESRKWIIVDLGINFPDETLPGIDRIVPDISFIEKRRKDFLGIVLTHAHEDHLGAIPDLWTKLEVPIYGTAFAIELLQSKMAADRLNCCPMKFHTVYSGKPFDIGPFNIEYVPVAHSIPESSGLIIRTPLGMVYHSGDWRIDPAPQIGDGLDTKRLESLASEGCRVLISDSTNALYPGCVESEGEVLDTLKALIGAAKGLVAVTSFASNVARLRSVAIAAASSCRQVVVVGRTLERTIAVAQSVGYLNDVQPFLSEEALGSLDRHEVVVIVTGSQGEPRSVLTRAALGNYPLLRFSAGDTVIFSSRTIPRNEGPVARVQNALVNSGVRLITIDDALVHVSGHARRNELLLMYGWLKPDCVIPIHGEPIHLEAQALLAESEGIRVLRVRNGDVVRLLPGTAEKEDKIIPGRLYKDGQFLVPESDNAVQERRSLSYAGCVVVGLLLDKKAGKLIVQDIVFFGIPSPLGSNNHEWLFASVEASVNGVLDSLSQQQRLNSDRVETAVKRAVRADIEYNWGKKPICEVMIFQS